jgi:hypothetical protein
MAVGLMHRPQGLFLDEPTTELDSEAREDIGAEIARLTGAEGLTVAPPSFSPPPAGGIRFPRSAGRVHRTGGR